MCSISDLCVKPLLFTGEQFIMRLKIDQCFTVHPAGESHGVSGIQNLMETFLSSAAAVTPPGGSTSCNGATTNGYLHSPVIKQAEAV